MKSPAPKVDFPSDWPVDSDDPALGLQQQTCLAPGPLVHACGGADVFIGKAASQKKANQQNYLCLLPGNLQLSSASNDKKGLLNSQDSDKEDEEEDDEMDDPDDAQPQKEKTKASTKLKKIGRMDTFSTNPVLALTLDQDQDPTTKATTLQFQGQHLPTTSKFIIVSFQPKKKKQRVTVKHVFTSLVVFGNGRLVGPGAGDAIVVDTSIQDSDSQTTELDHYGGSSRAKHSGSTGKWIQHTAHAPSRLKSMQELESEESEDDESSTEPIRLSSAAPPPRRSSLSRQSKSNKINLTENEEDDDDESADGVDHDDSDDSDDSSNRNARVPVRSRSTKPPTTDTAKGTKKLAKGAAPTNSRSGPAESDMSDASASVIELSSDHDDTDDDSSASFRIHATVSKKKRGASVQQVANGSGIKKRIRRTVPPKPTSTRKGRAESDKTSPEPDSTQTKALGMLSEEKGQENASDDEKADSRAASLRKRRNAASVDTSSSDEHDTTSVGDDSDDESVFVVEERQSNKYATTLARPVPSTRKQVRNSRHPIELKRRTSPSGNSHENKEEARNDAERVDGDVLPKAKANMSTQETQPAQFSSPTYKQPLTKRTSVLESLGEEAKAEGNQKISSPTSPAPKSRRRTGSAQKKRRTLADYADVNEKHGFGFS